ncbi:MAG: 1-acyl-sn-glycerol-3-phosphate acyltransferase, partial [Flavobacteriaceae bacterium]|nr:1-acyl-sn-glycerol-3-phosphate acyltransferase [Candidatus Onthonaster equi]
MMDIMTVLTVLKHHPIVFVGKAELGKIPIFGRIYKRICIMVDRSSLKSRARVIPDAKHKLNQNLSIFIFPEGGVSDDTSIVLDKFKDGAYNIAVETQTPIAVLAIEGLKEMFPFDWFKGYPGKVKVTLLDIIPTEGKNIKDHKTELKEYTYNIIRKEIE